MVGELLDGARIKIIPLGKVRLVLTVSTGEDGWLWYTEPKNSYVKKTKHIISLGIEDAIVAGEPYKAITCSFIIFGAKLVWRRRNDIQKH